MPLFGKRNLVMLLVIKIFVIGLFLSGCQEGTNKSPVSTLLTGLDMTQATVDLTTLGEDVAKHNIVGTVVSQNTGEKLANITVSLIYENQLAATTKTTSDGQFYFAKVPAGLFDLAFASPDNTYASTTYILRVLEDGTTAPANPEVKMVAVNPGQIKVVAKIEGEIMLSGTGTKLANINVELEDANGTLVSTALTSSLGQFSFSNLGVGTYTIIAGKATNYEEGRQTVTIRDDGVVSPKYTILSLSQKAIENFSIIGYVRTQSRETIPNLEVKIYSDSSLTSAALDTTFTTGEGKFFFYGLKEPKIYFIRASKSVSANTEASDAYPVRILSDGTTSPITPEILVIRNDNATLHDIEGYVYDPFTGGPLEYVAVKLGNGISVLTDKNGRYTFSDLLPGTYKIEIYKFGYETLNAAFQLIQEDSGATKTIPTNMSYPLVHSLKTGYGSIAGRLLEIQTGNGRSNKFVRAFNWVQTTKEYIDANGRVQQITDWEIVSGPILTTKTSADGSDEIPDLAGSFKLTHLTPGRYALGFFETDSYKFKDEIRAHGVKWQVIDSSAAGYIDEIRNLSVEAERTTYWTNYEQEYK